MKAIRSADTDLVVITHFSKLKAVLFCCGLFGAVGLLWLASFFHPADMSLEGWYASKSQSFYAGIFVNVMCTAVAIISQVRVLRRLIRHDTAAIWRYGDEIFFLNENFFDGLLNLSKADIRAVSQETWRFISSIVLTFKDGTKDLRLPNRTYLEPTEVIVARFRNAVGLGL